MAICPSLREEFQLKNFGFSGVKAERFCQSQWRMPVALYMTYRFLLMVYGAIWLGYITINRGDPSQAWGAYLTIWTYITLNIYLMAHFLASFIFHAVMLCRRSNGVSAGKYLFGCPSTSFHGHVFEEVDQSVQSQGDYEAIPGTVVSAVLEFVQPPRPPLYICAVWILYNVVSSAALMVTIVFFAFLFPYLSDYPNINLENLQVHLLNSVIILMEHLISGVPYRLLHVIFPFSYGLIYMTFSVIYWSEDHSRVMYPNILDWNHPGTTVAYVLMIGFVFIPILHSFFFLMYKVKMAIYQRCNVEDNDF